MEIPRANERHLSGAYLRLPAVDVLDEQTVLDVSEIAAIDVQVRLEPPHPPFVDAVAAVFLIPS